ncbi:MULTISPECIES: DUF4232 domain-containing protein [Streptomyces]|uniref:DUF4232 domain-containing protein n=1 Tax=Streptomyces TaxID=1883 RepID=UPI0004C26CF4|nr:MULTISPECIES: DUF4232 domain-containing protein [Streptomyces]
MRKRPLTVAALAVLVLSGGLVACDDPRVDAFQANCTTKGLKWKVTVLKKKARTPHREARLSAVNTGANGCVFRGYPDFMVHAGKAWQADAVGQGRTRPVSLPSGKGVVVDLRYRDAEVKPTEDGGCWAKGDDVVVGAPRDGGRTAIKAQDEKGRRTDMVLCDYRISMAPPRAAG